MGDKLNEGVFRFLTKDVGNLELFGLFIAILFTLLCYLIYIIVTDIEEKSVSQIGRHFFMQMDFQFQLFGNSCWRNLLQLHIGLLMLELGISTML